MSDFDVVLTKEEAALCGSLLAIASGVMTNVPTDAITMRQMRAFTLKIIETFPNAQAQLLEKMTPENVYTPVKDQIFKS